MNFKNISSHFKNDNKKVFTALDYFKIQCQDAGVANQASRFLSFVHFNFQLETGFYLQSSVFELAGQH